MWLATCSSPSQNLDKCGPFKINFNEIFITIQIHSLKHMSLKILSANFRPFCLGHIVLTEYLKLHGSRGWHLYWKGLQTAKVQLYDNEITWVMCSWKCPCGNVHNVRIPPGMFNSPIILQFDQYSSFKNGINNIVCPFKNSSRPFADMKVPGFTSR